jgi:hypothetical protein
LSAGSACCSSSTILSLLLLLLLLPWLLLLLAAEVLLLMSPPLAELGLLAQSSHTVIHSWSVWSKSAPFSTLSSACTGTFGNRCL